METSLASSAPSRPEERSSRKTDQHTTGSVSRDFRMRWSQRRSLMAPSGRTDHSRPCRAAVAEVRDLARGLHPPILTEAGLGPALEALAERASVPVTIDAPSRRFPAALESAAYFVVAEALTNVARYASASAVRVEVRAEGDRLSVSVRDDGRGGADAGRGTGLRGLADRVTALGGRLEVESPTGGGTTVSAELPLPA